MYENELMQGHCHCFSALFLNFYTKFTKLRMSCVYNIFVSLVFFEQSCDMDKNVFEINE